MGLFGLFGGSTAKKQAQLGLRLMMVEEQLGAYAPLKAEVETLIRTGRLREFEGHYLAAWRSQELMPNGRRQYSALLRWIIALDDDVTANPTTYLDAFSTAYEKTPTPFWAGLYAAALGELADEVRGADWAHKVSDKRWATHNDLTQHAAFILDEAGSADGAEPFADDAWLEAAYNTALTSAPAEQFHGLWERLYALDPANIATLNGRGVHLLPRWRRTDPQDAEAFARAAIEPFSWGGDDEDEGMEYAVNAFVYARDNH